MRHLSCLRIEAMVAAMALMLFFLNFFGPLNGTLSAKLVGPQASALTAEVDKLVVAYVTTPSKETGNIWTYSYSLFPSSALSEQTGIKHGAGIVLLSPNSNHWRVDILKTASPTSFITEVTLFICLAIMNIEVKMFSRRYD
eukprot:Gb_07293 [translate_table: standard]